MRRLLVLAMLAISWVGFVELPVAAGQDVTKGIDQIRKEVLEVNERVDLAIRTRDTDALGRILSDTFDYTNQTGELLGKAQMLTNIQSGRLTTVAQKHSDSRLKIYGDTVVLTGISNTSLVYKGKASKGPRRFTRVYIKQNGQWRLVAQHVTLVAKDE
jgi:ketosteroid isomerase-like protein